MKAFIAFLVLEVCLAALTAFCFVYSAELGGGQPPFTQEAGWFYGFGLFSGCVFVLFAFVLALKGRDYLLERDLRVYVPPRYELVDGVFSVIESTQRTDIRIASIVAIGEFTWPHEMYVRYWYVVFITADAREHHLSLFVPKVRQYTRQIIGLLGGSSDLGVATSTTIKNRIVWPDDLQDHPLYEMIGRDENSLGDVATRGFSNMVTLALSQDVTARIAPNVGRRWVGSARDI